MPATTLFNIPARLGQVVKFWHSAFWRRKVMGLEKKLRVWISFLQNKEAVLLRMIPQLQQ